MKLSSKNTRARSSSKVIDQSPRRDPGTALNHIQHPLSPVIGLKLTKTHTMMMLLNQELQTFLTTLILNNKGWQSVTRNDRVAIPNIHTFTPLEPSLF